MDSLIGRNLSFIVPGALLLLLILIFSGTALLNVLIVVCSVFLICLVLIQRGKGGGLAGAFGGMGGSSAFGTKAGDVFTWTTVVTACVWFLIAMRLVTLTNHGGVRVQFGDEKTGSASAPAKETGIPPAKRETAPLEGTAPAQQTSAVPPVSSPGLPPALVEEPAPKTTPTPAKTAK